MCRSRAAAASIFFSPSSGASVHSTLASSIHPAGGEIRRRRRVPLAPPVTAFSVRPFPGRPSRAGPGPPPVQPSAGRGSGCWRWPLSSSRGRRCSSSRIRPPQIRPSRIQRRVRRPSPVARPPRRLVLRAPRLLWPSAPSPLVRVIAPPSARPSSLRLSAGSALFCSASVTTAMPLCWAHLELLIPPFACAPACCLCCLLSILVLLSIHASSLCSAASTLACCLC